MKSILFFTLFLLFSNFTNVNSPEISETQKLIHWEAKQKLRWKDFKGRAERRSEYSALTHSVISYNYEVRYLNNEPQIRFEVKCFFEPRQSWVKKNHKTKELLAHEQLHFDISELYARKLRQQLDIYLDTFDDKSDYQKESEAIFNVILEEWDQKQDQYDKETDHGRHIKRQEYWSKEVRQGLEEYKTYRKGMISLSNQES